MLVVTTRQHTTAVDAERYYSCKATMICVRRSQDESSTERGTTGAAHDVAGQPEP